MLHNKWSAAAVLNLPRLVYRNSNLRRYSLLLFLLIAAVLWILYHRSRSSEPTQRLEVFRVQDAVLWTTQRKWDIYRIPLLTYTPGGNLVAIAEGRGEYKVDNFPKVFVVRRSTDGGTTWSPARRIVDDGWEATHKHCSNLGTIFVDDMTATIFLMYVYCEFCPTRSLMLINSTDDGITWGRPRNISYIVGKKYVTHPSPGYGIQKKYSPSKGRLVVCGHGFYNGEGLVLLLSDDHGVTWRHGAFVPSVPFQNNKAGNFRPDECQPVELPDGSIYLVVRNQHRYKCHCKIIMRSYDGGESLPRDHMYLDTSLIEPLITSGVWYHNSVIFYSGPNLPLDRANLRLRWSYDHGDTWTDGAQIWKRKAGYSVITMVPNDPDHIYMIYERGINSPIEEIAVTKLKLQFNFDRQYGFIP